MIRHPAPPVLAKNLRQLADRLDDQGNRAIRQAQILAARGWPSSTNGTDGGRSSDPTTSTERAALNPGPYDDIDNRLAQQLSLAWHCCLELHASIDMILAHANDDDPISPLVGVCDRCGLICKGSGSSNRLHGSGLCHACNEAWRRWQRKNQGTRNDFIAATAGNAGYDNIRRRLAKGA